MDTIVRFFKDVLGFFMDSAARKYMTWVRVAIAAVVALVAYLFGGFQGILNTLAVILWIVAIFMTIVVIKNLVKDRSKQT
ncbi:hypothetical protein ACFL2D_03225 [Patescibacteria group bacterium]